MSATSTPVPTQPPPTSPVENGSHYAAPASAPEAAPRGTAAPYVPPSAPRVVDWDAPTALESSYRRRSAGGGR